jgi:selenocysteine lyase/cysteine desulfurase
VSTPPGQAHSTAADDWVIVDSTTSAINLAADLLELEPGDEVIVTDLEFMTGTYTFVGREPPVILRIVESHDGAVSPDGIASAIGPRTRAIHVAHVTVGSGFRHDLQALGDLAQARGVELILDVAQSLGVTPVDLSHQGITMAAGTASKWLLGPAGIGFLYIRRDFQDRPPPAPGWMGAGNAGDWELWKPEFVPSAARFHGGIPNLIGLYAAAAGLDLVQSIGVPTISERVEALCSYLIDRLEQVGLELWTPRPPEQRAGLVFFRGVNDEALESDALSRQITLGRFLGGIRVDPHFYNTAEELDLVVDLAERHAAPA